MTDQPGTLDNMEALFDSAVRSEAARDLPRAEEAYRRCLQAEPRHGGASLGLASVLLKRWWAARKESRPSTVVDPLLDEALWALRSARYFDPEFACRSLLFEATVIAEQSTQDAEEIYRQAIDMGGNDTYLAIGAYAEFLGNCGRFAEAKEEFEKALALKPESFMNLVNFGRLQVRKSPAELEFAEFLFRKAIQVAPHEAEGYYRLGDVLVAYSDDYLEEAIGSLRKALALDPSHEKAKRVLDEALAEANRSDTSDRGSVGDSGGCR